MSMPRYIMVYGLISSNFAFLIHMTKFSDIQTAELSIQSRPEQFTSNSVMVILEWSLSNSPIYYQQLLRNVSVTVIPHLEMITTFIGNMSIQLTLPYNTLYNVSVTQPGICGQPNQTAFIELFYSKLAYTSSNLLCTVYSTIYI